MQLSLRELLENRLNLTAPAAVTAVIAVAALSATGWQVLRWYDTTTENLDTETHPAVVSPQTPDPLPIILSANVFGAPAPAVANPGAGPAITREATGFVLRAAFAEENGSGGAIIENAAGQADWYTVGQNIAPGLVLKEVHPDHVIFDRGGSSERLQFERLADSALSQAASPAAGGSASGMADFTVEPGQPQPIPQDLSPEAKAELIRQTLEQLRNRKRN